MVGKEGGKERLQAQSDLCRPLVEKGERKKKRFNPISTDGEKKEEMNGVRRIFSICLVKLQREEEPFTATNFIFPPSA